MSAVGSAVRETGQSLSTVFRNPALRKVNLALAGSLIGDWAYATAVTVWAYGVGGVAAVGVWGVVRLVLMTVVTPFAGVIADRFGRKPVMVATDLARVVLVVAAAGAVQAGWVWPVFVLATITSLVGTPFRPAQQALLPRLAHDPRELTAANGTASTLESLAFFIGPALGALLLTVADVAVVFLVQAATFLWSAAMVSTIRVPDAPTEEGSPETLAQEVDAAEEGFWKESLAGFSTILHDPDLRLVSGVYGAQTIVAGASLVFGVAIAVDVAGFGPEGVGYLDAVLGIGAIVGGFVALARAAKFRLATDFGVGVLLWGLPLVLVSIWPAAAPAFLAMLLIGAANPIVDVNASTILQRLAPDAVLGRVFAALETVLIGTMALGSLLMPVLVALVGLRWALVVIAAIVLVVVVPAFGRLRRLDTTLAPPAGLTLLERIDLFEPLDAPTKEALARRMESLRVAAGAPVLLEGETGDRFYMIESGEVVVSRAGAELRREGPGDYFGEIALLRDVPRTATVTAVTDLVLQVLLREDFLGALDGSEEARVRVDDVVSRRLPV